MSTQFSRVSTTRLNQRGVALPLALLGLVMVSVLVTGALVTSTSEAALGYAHQDATTTLYAADGAVDYFIADHPDGLPVGKDDAYPVGGGNVAGISSSLLSSRVEAPEPGEAFHRRTEQYSVVAGPANGGNGRSVGVLAEHVRRFLRTNTNIDAAAIVGGQTVEVRGNVTISNESSDASCEAGPANYGIVLDKDSEVEQSGNVKVEGGIDKREEVDAEQLLAHVLGRDDLSIEAMAEFADKKFGFDERPAFGGSPRADSGLEPAHEYNWGCPTDIGVSACDGSDAEHTEHKPVVAINAAAPGTGDLNNHHGQGMLLITNSHGSNRFEIGGNFTYKGIVLVDGSVKIAGTPKIEGALIVMGDGQIDATGVGAGTVEIRHNQCSILAAEAAFERASATGGPPPTTTRTGWFEVVK